MKKGPPAGAGASSGAWFVNGTSPEGESGTSEAAGTYLVSGLRLSSDSG